MSTSLSERRADGDYQDEVRDFVNDEVGSNITGIITQLRDMMDYPFQFYQEYFDNLMREDENGERRQQEIYQYYTVSHWLYKKLKKRDQPVADFGSCKVWGRTTCGQAVLLDHVICEIYDNSTRSDY